MLGHTFAERQVHDLLAGIALMRRDSATGSVAVFGQGDTAPLAIYATLLDWNVSEIVCHLLPNY